MATLTEMDKAAQAYADSRQVLTDLVANLNALQEALARTEMPAIKRALAKAVEKHDVLKTMVEDSPQLFDKPKSVTMHGLKFGYRKGSGKMDFAYEDEKTIELIRKHVADDPDAYIITTEKPDKKALAELDGKQLKAIGAVIEGTGEVAFIKPVDGAVDKIVKALIKEGTEA